MKTRDLLELGVPLGDALKRATEFIADFVLKGGDKETIAEEVTRVLSDPASFVDDPLRGAFARAVDKAPKQPRKEPAPYRKWGEDLDEKAIDQMENACRLPVSVAGALMPDAHVGYGLPIGGVLATDNSVVPYAVGVDIACRMRMTVFDVPVRHLEKKRERLIGALEKETRFGIGASFKERREHEVMDEDWSATPVTKRFRDKAWAQLGTSGSGNHFVEFGSYTVNEDSEELPAGMYLALLSHSGSRGVGA